MISPRSTRLLAVDPAGVHPPAGPYSHAVVAVGPGRTVYVSGQVGVDPAGRLAGDFAAQSAQCWRNLVAVLAAADMTVHDLVKVTTFLTDPPAQAAEYARARGPWLGDARPASTLVGTPALARPEWLVEVEAIAFRGP